MQAASDERGNYEIFLKPSSYEMNISAHGYAAQKGWLHVREETRYDAKLHPAAHIHGVVGSAMRVKMGPPIEHDQNYDHCHSVICQQPSYAAMRIPHLC